jgi:hypothetical protein
MSRKHFKVFAARIAEIEDLEERQRYASFVGEACAECNCNFDWSIWLSACGVERK